jgi:hypothetical protein
MKVKVKKEKEECGKRCGTKHEEERGRTKKDER